MASSREAFGKFEMWKKEHTLLNLVDIDHSGAENKRSGEICHVDWDGLAVLFIDPKTRDSFPLDFREASFFVEDRFVEVLRSDRGCITLTEAE